jgi:hypothetical protein
MKIEPDTIDEIWDEAERELQAAGHEFDRFITEGEALTPPLSDEKRKERESRYVQLFTRLNAVALAIAERARAKGDFARSPVPNAKPGDLH